MSDKNHDFRSLVSIYSQILPRIRASAKKLGYAIAIHGTMQRDLDLLAVPWIEEAAATQVLVTMIAEAVSGFVIGDGTDNKGYVSEAPTFQPHGRRSWNICWGGHAFVDLSVMPPLHQGFRSKFIGEVSKKFEAAVIHKDNGAICSLAVEWAGTISEALKIATETASQLVGAEQFWKDQHSAEFELLKQRYKELEEKLDDIRHNNMERNE